jgi:hypothetical protein
VARQINRAVDVDRQVGVDLNQAAVVALIPVVAAPRFLRHVLDGECFVGRETHVRERPAAAFGNRQIEDARQPVRRDDELLPVDVEALDQRTTAREKPRELFERRREKRLGVDGRHRVVERLRFFVEAELRALEHAQPRPQRFELAAEILASENDERVAAFGGR